MHDSVTMKVDDVWLRCKAGSVACQEPKEVGHASYLG